MAGATGQTKILRVITRLNVGGPARHVTFLTERLNGGEFSTTLVAGSLSCGEGDMGPFAARRGIAVTSLPALGNERGLADDVRALVRLYRLVRAERPSIVHLHLLKARLLGGIAARLAGAPVIVETLHGHLLAGYYGPIKTRMIVAIERFIGRWIVDRIVVLSESQRRDLMRWRIGTPAKIEIVPLGLELQRLLAAPRRTGLLRRRLRLPDDRLLIGAVGRLVPIKGYDVFLRALRTIWEVIGVGVVAVIVGDGPLRQSLEDEADRLQIRHLVTFLGWRSDVEDVYGDLDVFVQPSINEGTPVSVIEAMAAGTPIVATRVGGVPDVVEDGRSGLLVPPGDPSALAAAILTLWRDPAARERLGEEARRQVRPRFGIDELTRQLQAVYVRSLAQTPVARDQAPAMERHSIQP